MVRPKRDKPRGVLNVRGSETYEGLRRYWPSEDLSPFVEHYWIVRWNVSQPEQVETLPHPSMHMVLERQRSEVVGVMRGRFTRMLVGEGRVVSTKFRPGAFRAFVDRPVASFSDRRWSLAAVFGDRAKDLEDDVFSLPDDLAAIAVVESFLRSLEPEPDESIEVVARIVGRIADDRSITRVDQIAAECNLTLRQLQRLFREYVGATPKWVIQRYRLIEAAERLAAGSAPDLADLAFELGFSDQPHFIREFKKVVGRAPGDYGKSLT